MIDVHVQLGEAEAEALAQFVKRIGWKEWRNNARSDEEAVLMRDACDRLRNALGEAGFRPR